MKPNETQYDRDCEQIWKAYNDGLISNEEAWRQQRELDRDMRGAVEEAAWDAYQDTMNDWGFR